MTIEIHQPELEALIQQRMATGAFVDIDELLTRAISALEVPAASTSDAKSKSLEEVFESARGLLTDEEVDTLFCRQRSYGRPIDLS
jgi:hypothetical protein